MEDSISATHRRHQQLVNWLRHGGFTPDKFHLSIGNNTDGVRGIVALKTITLPSVASSVASSKKCVHITIPSALLITPARIRTARFTRELFTPQTIQAFNDTQLLALYLMYHRRLGNQSPCAPYIQSLPFVYSSIEWWYKTELALLEWPSSTEMFHLYEIRKRELRKELQQINAGLLEKNKNFCASSESPLRMRDADNMPLHLSMTDAQARSEINSSVGTSNSYLTPPFIKSLFTLTEYQWAAGAIATRTCYLPGESEPQSKTGSDRSCMIPFLDIFNHSSNVRVAVEVDPVSKSYSLLIRTTQPNSSSVRYLEPGEEVTINYGEHNNLTLLTRYGFVLTNNFDDSTLIMLNDIESFLCNPHAGRNDYLKRLHNLFRSAESTTGNEINQSVPVQDKDMNPFVGCHCGSALLDLVDNVPLSKVCLRWMDIIPVFKQPSQLQLKLLRACGLYDIENALLKNGKLEFKLTPCSLSWNLLTYLKIRCLPENLLPHPVDATQIIEHLVRLNIVDARTGAMSLRPASIPNDNKRPHLKSAIPHEKPISSQDFNILTSLFLNDGWLNESHRLLVHNTIVGLVTYLFYSRFATSLWNDLEISQIGAKPIPIPMHHPHTAFEENPVDEVPSISDDARELCRQYRISQKRLMLGVIHHFHIQTDEIFRTPEETFEQFPL